jgi:single-strand DNA-binding protein
MNTTTIAITANLVSDPELRFTPGGKAVTNLRLAVNSRVKVAEGEYKDGTPTFYELRLWEDAAENAAESYHRGDLVLVFGQLHTESWEYEGSTRSKLVITGAEIGASSRFATLAIAKNMKRQQ